MKEVEDRASVRAVAMNRQTEDGNVDGKDSDYDVEEDSNQQRTKKKEDGPKKRCGSPMSGSIEVCESGEIPGHTCRGTA